jgi:hypothetical protein
MLNDLLFETGALAIETLPILKDSLFVFTRPETFSATAMKVPIT